MYEWQILRKEFERELRVYKRVRATSYLMALLLLVLAITAAATGWYLSAAAIFGTSVLLVFISAVQLRMSIEEIEEYINDIRKREARDANNTH